MKHLAYSIVIGLLAVCLFGFKNRVENLQSELRAADRALDVATDTIHKNRLASIELASLRGQFDRQTKRLADVEDELLNAEIVIDGLNTENRELTWNQTAVESVESTRLTEPVATQSRPVPGAVAPKQTSSVQLLLIKNRISELKLKQSSLISQADDIAAKLKAKEDEWTRFDNQPAGERRGITQSKTDRDALRSNALAAINHRRAEATTLEREITQLNVELTK